MVIKIIVGELQSNCYIFYDKYTKEAAIIDPGDEPDKIIDRINNYNLKPKIILNTHCHFDHVGANADIKELFNIPLAISKADADCLLEAHLHALSFLGKTIKPSPKPDIILSNKEKISVGNLDLSIIETPGHTKGSLSFYQKDSNILFSGDTLFYESVGRWDLPGGNEFELLKSIKKLLKLPQNTIVYPGHGPDTTIAHELKYNPFIF